MPLTSGARLGPYEILSPLGAGGMGEVYKARDTRLDRIVAIKVLPAALASDPELRERFEREARAISQLTHPHICTLHDVGEATVSSPDSSATSHVRFLVMEFLEGHTLADRLAKGALPLAEALRIAIEVTSALDAAHRTGIVHRDVKPGNVILTKSGAKLLDFGLAKTGAPVVAPTSASLLATTPPNITVQGAILGTFQYMAPEQVEGQEADARTDIFAFGAMLYEMLTGRKAFEGKTQASLIGAILERDPPPVSAIQPLTPPLIDRIDPRDGFTSPVRGPRRCGCRSRGLLRHPEQPLAQIVRGLPSRVGIFSPDSGDRSARGRAGSGRPVPAPGRQSCPRKRRASRQSPSSSTGRRR